VLFVRHALPGEQVVAEVTALGRKGRSVHADVVEVLVASPQRRVPSCPVAGRCGGCDWQHTTPAAARGLKAQVVREALARFAGVTLGPEFVVEPVADPATGEPLDWLGWRTRGTLSVDAAGRAGMRAGRSHAVVVGPGCPQLHASLAPLALFERRWEPSSRVGFVAPAGAAPLAFEAGRAPAEPVVERAVGARWQVAADGFWQVHPGAATALVEHVAAVLAPRPGERLVDLYAGVGLFGLSLARLVGADAPGTALAVTLVEGDRRASELAAVNAGDLPVTVVRAPVDRWVARPGAPARADLVVLDPPRVGAGAAVVRALAAAQPRAIAYVACDPVALARDVATFQGLGCRLEHLVALDLFPATHHVECVALLVPAEARA
jgi:tRNA/tmRNA/rRNA uracil-C5-methylase (TrmA/RlmC/RlmD family)